MDASIAKHWELVLGPVSLGEFTRAFYERVALHVERSASDRFSALFGWRDVEVVLWQHEVEIPNFARVSKDGEKAEIPRNLTTKDYSRWVVDKYLSGWTVTLGGLEATWLPIARVARAIEWFAGGHVSAKSFMTPRQSRGFLPHFDTRDILVLQIEGSKRWCLYDTPIELPRLTQSARASRKVTAPSKTLLLRAGETLYIPRGVIHSAETDQEDSLHVTIGLRPRCWVDVLASAIEIAAEDEPALRRSVPPELDASQARELATRIVPLLMNRLCAKGTMDRSRARLEKRFIAGLRVLPDDLLDSSVMVDRLCLHHSVEKRLGTLCHVGHPSPDHVELVFPGMGESDGSNFQPGAILAPGYVEAAFRFIAAAEGAFPIACLPGLSDSARLVLARRLVREGLLRIAASRSTEVP